MRLLPLFRFSARARSTSWGIALCTMFIVASFSVAGGLETSMNKLVGNFSSDYSLITKSDTNGPAYFSATELVEVKNKTAFGKFEQATVLESGQRVTVFTIMDSNVNLPDAPWTSGNDVLVGLSLSIQGEITLVGNRTVNATATTHYSSTTFPPTWIYASLYLMNSLTGEMNKYNFAIAKGLTGSEASGLSERGFSVQALIGIVQFLDNGVKEIESDASWVLVPSAFVIAVLAYSFIGSETADRRHDIGILKTLGAGRRRVLAYLLLNALVIAAWGGLIGVALGVVMSYAVSTAASAMFTSVFILETSEMLLVISFLATLAAGVLGALIPAARMTFTSPVSDLKEVTSFS